MEKIRIHDPKWNIIYGGDINNRKTGTVGEMTKNVRMYGREMKAKYNKEYKQLNFDKNIEQKIEDEKRQQEEDKKRQKEEVEKRQVRENDLNILIIQNLIYQEDNLTKEDLEYIRIELYRSIENVAYTYYFDFNYQKTTRLIQKHNLDLQFYNDKENDKYIQYKQQLEQ